MSDVPNPANELRGEITADPAPSVPIGDQLYFEAIRVHSNLQPGLGASNDLQIFNGVLLSMQFGGAQGYSVDGSAALVAPGVALCATHVIEPHFESLLSGNVGCLCLGLARSALQVWRLQTFTPVPGADLTILGLTYNSCLPEDRIFRQWTIQTRLPRRGDRLTLAGFRPSSTRVSDDGGIHAHGNLLVSSGTVSEEYPEGRDKGMMPWPVVEVACAALGAMSGGPVYNDDGELVGLVCSSNLDETGVGGHSYVSLLWPALGYQFSGGWPPGILRERTSLLEVDPRCCTIIGRDAVQVMDDDKGGHWRYVSE